MRRKLRDEFFHGVGEYNFRWKPKTGAPRLVRIVADRSGVFEFSDTSFAASIIPFAKPANRYGKIKKLRLSGPFGDRLGLA
jgi:hypothetical protein